MNEDSEMIPSPYQHGNFWDLELSLETAIERHVAVSRHDPDWVDEAVSNYAFNSGDDSREAEYKIALSAVLNGDPKPFQALIEKAIKERARSEIEAASREFDFDSAA